MELAVIKSEKEYEDLLEWLDRQFDKKSKIPLFEFHPISTEAF